MTEATTEVPDDERQTPIEVSSTRRWMRPLISLKVRDFRWLWISMLASFSTFSMQQVARGWLIYNDMNGTATDLGYVSVAWGIPILLISLPAGVVTDRVNKRNLMIAAQTAMGAITVPLFLLIWSGQIEMWHLVIGGLFMGGAFAFNGPSRQAIVPELVSQRNLMNAIALNSSAMNLTRIAGPALAGVLIGIIAVSGVYFLMVVMYLIAVLTLLLVTPPRSTRPKSTKSPFADLMEGLRFIRNNRTILTLLSLELMVVLFAFPYTVLMPVFAKDVFMIGAEGYGLLLAVTGAGALAGSLTVASLGDYQRKGLLLILAAAGFGLGLPIFAYAGSFYLSLFFLLVIGFCATSYMAFNNTLLLSITPPEIRGRVMSIYMMTFGLMTFTALPAGILSDAIGAPLTLSIGGGILAVYVLFVFFAVPSIRRLS